MPGVALQRCVAVPAQTAVYCVSADNVLLLSFGTNAQSQDACGALVAAKPVLAAPHAFGPAVTGVSLCAETGALFVGGAAGTFAIALGTGAVTRFGGVEGAPTSLLYAAAWRQLFVATPVALYTYAFAADANAWHEVAHEWIGGNLDYAPIDMAFDDQSGGGSGALWVAENMTVHRLAADGLWQRFGYKQRAPIDQISSVAVRAGVVWVGSAAHGLARLVNDDPQAAVTASGDPWAWAYYGGARWLPSDSVLGLFCESSLSGNDEASVLVATDAGLSLLHLSAWTLAQKAVAMQSFQEPRHNRYGLSSSVDLRAFGDVATPASIVQTCDDNDGLWSSMSGMAAAYRALIAGPGDVEAHAAAFRIFAGTERQNILAGNFPHYPARSFAKMTDPSCYSPTDPAWYVSPVDAAWAVKGDTSSDELCGHLAFYPMMYDVAQTDAERARVLAVLDGIVGGIVANNLSVRAGC